MGTKGGYKRHQITWLLKKQQQYTLSNSTVLTQSQIPCSLWLLDKYSHIVQLSTSPYVHGAFRCNVWATMWPWQLMRHTTHSLLFRFLHPYMHLSIFVLEAGKMAKPCFKCHPCIVPHWLIIIIFWSLLYSYFSLAFCDSHAMRV